MMLIHICYNFKNRWHTEIVVVKIKHINIINSNCEIKTGYLTWYLIYKINAVIKIGGKQLFSLSFNFMLNIIGDTYLQSVMSNIFSKTL